MNLRWVLALLLVLPPWYAPLPLGAQTRPAPVDIEARLDPATHQVSGDERIVYLNRSPDTLSRVALHLRQNVFAPATPRKDPALLTEGMRISHLALHGVRHARLRLNDQRRRGLERHPCARPS